MAQDPKWNPDAEGFKARTRPKARLDTAQLVGALNEQLQERNAGNMAYRAKRFDQAMGAFRLCIKRTSADARLTRVQSATSARCLS